MPEIKEEIKADISKCIKTSCESCKIKNNCEFNKFLTHCIELAIDVFHPLKDNLKTMKFSELLTMLGYAVGMLRKLGLEQEFLTMFPKDFRKLVTAYLDSINIENE